MKIVSVCLVSIFVVTISCGDVLSEEYQKVPAMYQMDEYKECKRENGLYCKVTFRLLPDRSDNAVWKIIQKEREDRFKFRRDIIYRYRCLPRKLLGNDDGILMAVTKIENDLLRNVSLFAQPKDKECWTYEEQALSRNDLTFLYLLISYLIIVLIATFYHTKMQNSKAKHFGPAHELLVCFSLKRNWNKFLQPVDIPNYNRLKSFQGLRVICMLLIIGAHGLMGAVTISITNPGFLENLYSNGTFRYMVYFGMHLVQVYFLISAWLLSSNLFRSYVTDKKVTLGMIIQAISFRYVRLVGPLALFVLFGRTDFFKFIERGQEASHIHKNYENCNNNGWATLFLYNSLFYSSDQCHFTSWYVSVDFLLFLATILLFVVSVNFKLTKKQVLQVISIVLGVTWTIIAIVIYMYRFPVILETSPERAKIENSLISFETYALYTNPLINIGGYCVGLIAGAIYSQINEIDPEVTKWLTRGVSISLLMIYLAMQSYTPFITAVLGASIKPLFNFGLACSIFGVAFSKQGILKSFLEWNIFELPSKITYSVYISHFWIAFGFELFLDGVYTITIINAVTICAVMLILSYIWGLVIYLIFESPFRAILSVVMNGMPKNRSNTGKAEQLKQS